MAVYLLHFQTPYKHARHYIGFAKQGNVERRIAHHRDRSGARLMAVVVQAGIDFVTARVWPDGDRTFERRLKKCHKPQRFCPICNPQHGAHNMTPEKLNPHAKTTD